MTVAERMFGLETEYAFTAVESGLFDATGKRAAATLIKLARMKLPHLSDVSSLNSRSIFLQNGSRLYEDCGAHPEIGCCEVTNPWDAVRYALAGDRIITDLASDYEENHPGTEAVVSKCNVDYRSRTTWGCHSSYLHQADPDVLPSQMMPFLASQVVFTGAGGFNPLSLGLEFVVSPRAFFIVDDISDSSTSDRPLFHIKDESLCGNGYHRLHILGETTCSETATWLKVGTTALVVALIEAGIHPARNIRLRSPVEALHSFARDPSCKTKVRTDEGRQVTAVELQRLYLAETERHIQELFMPSWADEVCRRWRIMLDTLEQGVPESVTTVLDWGMKLALYQDRIKRRGFSWESLQDWTHVLKQIMEALHFTEYRDKRVSMEFLLGSKSPPPVAEEVKCLSSVFLPEKGLCWDSFRPFLVLREEMLELDARFSQLGEKGVFAAMDRTGVLAHHVPGVEDIELAMSHPPDGSRARLRGDCVRDFSGKSNGRFTCGWDKVCDHHAGDMLDISDPFGSRAQWRPMPDDEEDEEMHSSVEASRRIRDLYLSRMRNGRRSNGSDSEADSLSRILFSFEDIDDA